MSNTCIECKDKSKPVRYWGSSLCEECFSKLLNDKLKEDEDHQKSSQKVV